MARLSVDEGSRRDPRITKLAKLTGELRFTTVGRIQEVWWVCYDRKTAVVPREDVDLLAEMDGFAEAMVTCRLAEAVDPDHIRVKGAEERIDYLLGQAEKGRKSAEVRAAKNTGSTTAQPVLSTGSELLQPTSSSDPSGDPPEESAARAQDPPPAGPVGIRTSHVVRRLWEFQNRLRQEAGRDALSLTRDRAKAVEGRLRDGYTEIDLERVQRDYAAEAKRTGEWRWMNGETNWRASNVSRVLGGLKETASGSRGSPSSGSGAVLRMAEFKFTPHPLPSLDEEPS